MISRIVLVTLAFLLPGTSIAGDLHQAAKKGDLPKVEALLSTNVDVDEKDRNGRTALFLALSRGRLDVAQRLVDADADVVAEVTDAYDATNTPFHFAIYKGYTDLVRSMLEMGADPNLDNFAYGPPLHIAMERGHVEMAKLLQENGAASMVLTESIGDRLSGVDLERGKTLARGCEACHSMQKTQTEEQRMGPRLWNIVGRRKASLTGYDYSAAFQKLTGYWTYADLNSFLHNPRSYSPGTKMVLSGIRSDKDRMALVAYLRMLADEPVPLPK